MARPTSQSSNSKLETSSKASRASSERQPSFPLRPARSLFDVTDELLVVVDQPPDLLPVRVFESVPFLRHARELRVQFSREGQFHNANLRLTGLNPRRTTEKQQLR